MNVVHRYFFFFSSRRRHTRSLRDWSSDVCSSDLDDEGGFLAPTAAEQLVADGFTVEIATTHPVVGAEIDPTQQPFVFRRLALAGVAMTPHLSGLSSDADGVTLRNIYTERDERREGVGLVVMAGYRRAVVELRDALTTLRPELRLV